MVQLDKFNILYCTLEQNQEVGIPVVNMGIPVAETFRQKK